jgi:L-histidine N-alpha-methyltransferase
MVLPPITIAIHTFGQHARDELVADVRRGLTQPSKALPPRWFYDDRGSALFDAITQLPEYYLTRTETEILSSVSNEIMAMTRPESLVELGAGSSEKTRLLIEAGIRDRLGCFVPFDVSEAALQQAARRLASDFPSLCVYAVVGSFAEHLDRVPRYGDQLVVFLGSTIGNLSDAELSPFLGSVRSLLKPGDAFLLGIDLVKDEAQLCAAYNDAQGVTAEFNLNVLRVLNRELGADFDVDAFEHVATYNPEQSRIEMYVRARRPQRVSIPGAALTVDFEGGEMLLTEMSAKYTRESIERPLRQSGLAIARWYTDPRSWFALCLCVPSDNGGYAGARRSAGG